MRQILTALAVLAVFWLWGAGHRPPTPPLHHPAVHASTAHPAPRRT